METFIIQIRRQASKLYLLDVNVTRFFCFVREFFLFVVQCQSIQHSGLGWREEYFSCKYLTKTFLLSALLFNIRLRVLSCWVACLFSPLKIHTPPSQHFFSPILTRLKAFISRCINSNAHIKRQSINLLFLTPNFLTLVRAKWQQHKYVLLSI